MSSPVQEKLDKILGCFEGTCNIQAEIADAENLSRETFTGKLLVLRAKLLGRNTFSFWQSKTDKNVPLLVEYENIIDKYSNWHPEKTVGENVGVIDRLIQNPDKEDLQAFFEVLRKIAETCETI